MFIQLQSISLYLLIVFCISSYAVREVAFTYLRFNSYSNMIWLFVFYCICNGTTIIQEIKIFLDLVLFECNTMLIVGVLFLFVDWVFKLAVF
jgi:NADH:ubiquinone oxidoreductase subunit 2 (subunit N)